MTGWSALTAALNQDSVSFTWSELDLLVGGLPPSAAKYRAWWSGDRPHVRVWRDAGYAVANLDLGRGVTFVRGQRSSVPEQRALPATIDIVLIACGKTKLSVPAPAQDLYISPGFRKSRGYAESLGKPWFILSAEYGVLAPTQLVAPYDRYLPDMPDTYRAAWGAWAVERLALFAGPLAGRAVEVHAGAVYVDAIAPHLASKQALLIDRLKGLRQGERQAWYNNGVRGTTSPEDSLGELLAGQTGRSPSEFLATAGAGLQVPGLYSWWVDQAGADDLSRGLRHFVAPGLVYAGLAGATRWPSGKRSSNTLWSRIATMHLGGNHEFSTFRRTLGSILAAAAGHDRIDEGLLTTWMYEHLRVVTSPWPDPDTLGQLEEQVLRALNPPLNLKGMPPTPIRTRITDLRRAHA